MADVSTRETSPNVSVDDNILRDMVDIDAMQALLEAFGQICGTGAGVFTPEGVRIGRPAHHHAFCDLLYDSPEGRKRCERCDKKHIDIIRKGGDPGAYKCDNGLVDFCVPVYLHHREEPQLIGVFFAGQVLYEEDKVTSAAIQKVRSVAVKCKVDPDELLARYMQVRRVPRSRVRQIITWMRQFSRFLGLLVERKAVIQQLLLEVIASGDNPDAIVRAVQQHLQPGAVSIFLQRDDVPDAFRERIFLVATTFKELAGRLSLEVEEDIDKISYRSGEGFTGWVYKTGNTLHVPNVWDRDRLPRIPYRPKWRHKIQEVSVLEDTQAFLGCPIRAGDGEVIGVIRAVRLKRDPGFRGDEIELLSGIASVVGAAVDKAHLYAERTEKMEVLSEAQDLLDKLTRPGTDLQSIASSMVTRLARRYVQAGKWKAVYVLQHLKSSRQFQFVASFPPPSDLPDKYRGTPFSDTEGVAGHVLRTRSTVAQRTYRGGGVVPTTPWTSVVCAPIFHAKELWGVVSLCGHHVSQTNVDLAAPKIAQFAENMSLVCRLGEVLDARNSAASIASNVLSLNLEAHEVYKSLEGAKIAVMRLSGRTPEHIAPVMADLGKEIEDSLSWANVCVELGRYVKSCATDPNSAIESFRTRHLPMSPTDKVGGRTDQIWEPVDITEVAGRALVSVEHLAKTHKARVTSSLSGPCVVVGDGNLLYRALRNLLENAIVHGSMIKGPEPTFRFGVEVSLSTERTGDNRVGIVIEDNGEGMDGNALAASKELYANPCLLGSADVSPGFGTAIVAFAVSVHLGRIDLTSEFQKGTRLHIEIPLDDRVETNNAEDRGS